MSSRKRAIGIAVAVSLLVAAATWALMCHDCTRELDPSHPLKQLSLMAAGSDHAAPTGEGGDPAAGGRSLAQAEEAVFVRGSLRGTDFPGWGVGRGQPLTPNRALRDRFDHYLLAMGEASIAELSGMLRAHAVRDLGDATAAEVMAVWERYLQLQRHEFKLVAKLDDPASMQASLQEQRQVRQTLLGAHWAVAFYGEEEAQLAADIDPTQRRNPPAPDPADALLQPPAGTDAQALRRDRTARFGPDAAQRMSEIDKEQSAWEQRIALAQSQLELIRHDAGLSDVQRSAAITRYLEAEFGTPSERLRASALLGL